MTAISFDKFTQQVNLMVKSYIIFIPLKFPRTLSVGLSEIRRCHVRIHQCHAMNITLIWYVEILHRLE